MPWLSRYQHQAGWSDASGWKNAKSLTHWIASSSAAATVYATGAPPPLWLTDGRSQLTHLCGIGSDRMWLRYPLEGDFELHVELSDGNWRESSLVANGIRFSSNGYNKAVDVNPDNNRDWARFPTGALKTGKWNQHTISFAGDTLTYLVNGTVIYEEPRKDRPPWIALHSPGQRDTGARGLWITGNPRIPRSVNLLMSDDLRGWSSEYYGQPLPTTQINSTQHEPDVEAPRRIRTAPAAESVANLAWTVKEGTLISGGATRRGPKAQSVIRYERPLAEGETLSYEFFYEADKTAVFPTLGRTAYILRPDGVRLHWMTEGGNSWKTPHDFEASVETAERGKPQLREGDWNQVTIQIIDATIQIHLNDALVFEQEARILPQGLVFGLFHYADKTNARIRDIELTASWPEKIPKTLFETIAE